MDQRLSLISIGVADMAAARAFYVDGMGWQPSGPSGDDILFFQLPGLVHGITLHSHLSGGVTFDNTSAPKGYREFAVAVNVHSRDEVHQTMATADAAGAKTLKQPVSTDWGGYSGYFADPDGNAWEVAHPPGWEITADGQTFMAG
jgi:catechol 2,3-dioxygenase-like lactoylglutathione lyase family enzyme